MRVIFLHIPKTAGQSIHQALVDAFGKDQVCPARVNEQLLTYSISELNKYNVFSGHFDWSMLDCVKGQTFVFTVLRKPMDRILSFYFYLRGKASKMSREQLADPSNQGLRAALQLSPRDYFGGSTPHLRSFLDDHYDNFYTYYFAGRTYDARRKLVGLINRGVIRREDVSRLARENLARLDGVFDISEMPRVLSVISEISGKPLQGEERYRTNINKNLQKDDRLDELISLGADAATIDLVNRYCELDQPLWESYAPGKS